MNLDHCLILNLRIGSWIDKRLPREIFVETIAAVSALRNHFYATTLPWKGNGDRLIARRFYPTFAAEHTSLCEQFETAVAQLEFRLSDAFPASKFYVVLDIDAVSPGYDNHLETSADIQQARIANAVAGLWEKLSKPLEHFTEKMGDTEAVFRDTTVSNLRDIVTMLPELNFTGDADLMALGDRIGKHITCYEAKDLRTNLVTRKAVASEAQEILDSMAGFMNAFGGQSDDTGT